MVNILSILNLLRKLPVSWVSNLITPRRAIMIFKYSIRFQRIMYKGLRQLYPNGTEDDTDPTTKTIKKPRP